MPIGSFAVLPDVVNELVKKQPRSVLDLGIGFGMYGAAIREWLDMGVKPYKTQLDGVEFFEQYRSQLWELYDKVFIEPIETFLPQDYYDAIIMLDVIEHFEKYKGIALLNSFKTWLAPGGILIIGTPAIFQPQGAVYGNEKETHLSLWSEEDFIALGFSIIHSGKQDKYGHQMILAKYQN